MSTMRPIPTPLSSNVVSISWDSKHSIMYVRYKSGNVYAYEGVPYQRAVRAAKARSVGTYINKKIKPNYPYKQVG